MAHKMANHNGSNEVATNEIQDGSFKPIEEQPATDYNSYPPNPGIFLHKPLPETKFNFYLKHMNKQKRGVTTVIRQHL